MLAGTVAAVHAEPASDRAIVQLHVGNVQLHLDDVQLQVADGAVRLLAEVTRDAVARLRLAPGAPVHALIKSVSIDVAGGAEAGS